MDESETIEQVGKILNRESAPLDEKSFPTAVGIDGWPLDPTMELHVRLPKPGEPDGLDSIFGAPPGPGDQVKIVTVQEQLEMLYKLGFRGQAIFSTQAGPHPLARSKTERISRAKKYPITECKICTALIAGEEKMNGYRLLELKHAGLFGCSTCFVLYRGITSFARKLGLKYEDWESEVGQETLKDSKLLSESTSIQVSFSLDGEGVSTIFFTCDGNVQSEEYSVPKRRIMDTSSYNVVELVQGWLKTCLEEHEECMIPKISILPSRLIEVSNHRAKLCNTEGKMGAYLALSHCWGLNPIIKTLKNNIEERMNDIPWNSLSKTFQDAILFTWRLGYRYIWIDSLCIIQDDNNDWEIQASRMAGIFNNAQMTISATRSADGAGGCFSNRSQEPFHFSHQIEKVSLSNPSLWNPFEIPGKDRDGLEKDFFIQLKPEHGILESPLLQRAWVFQEQILSPRIVHFAPSEMYWECKSYISCECAGWEKRSETLELATRQRKAHKQLVGRTTSLQNASTQSSEKEAKRDFEAYEALVEQYTAMNITKDFDCLPALSGIAFGRQDEYLAGMWRSILLKSLHWLPKKSDKHNMTYRPSPFRAPSWSWASVQGPIQHLKKPRSYEKDDDGEVATILAAVCTPEGQDPRGRVVGGYLKIQGQAMTAIVKEIGVRDAPGNSESDTYSELLSGTFKNKCSLDIPLVLAKVEPAEAVVRKEVLLLRISTLAALVLCVIEDTPGAYRRIGIMEIENGKGKGKNFFSQARKTSVFIL